ncbi:hypothetical protein SAMN04488587_0229 [Methanococcoides vulcani]|uniref:Prenylated flavin chaperone LpdD-like domain-containing protein n=2 Tax=Methanococcoides vulcani TaxID=1353158 RepID=A0A1H9Y476_9EURY|nr:hypothetical protein SAMN04488587_0229 [Methanococcoides vulcani]
MQEMRTQTSRGELLLEHRIIGEDLVITLTGGKGHIGAVAVGYYDRVPGHASSSVITLPSHRDDAIALDAARRISSVTHSTTVVTVGINFENITVEEIEEVLSASNELIDEFMGSLKEK